MEIHTVPFGREESCEYWWARARLGFSTLSIWVWGGSNTMYAKGKWFTFVSQCIDKSAWYPFAVLNELADLIDWTGVTEFISWSDCGTHFRTRTIFTWFAEHAFLKVPGLRVTHVNFGPEHHMKCLCDGKFGHHSNLRKDFALRGTIKTKEELLELYKNDYDLRKIHRPEIAEEWYRVWIPPPRAAVECDVITLKSLRFSVTRVYSWSFTRKDFRRQTMRGIHLNALQLRNIDVRCHVVTGERCTDPFYVSVAPIKKPVPVAVAAIEAAVPPLPAPAVEAAAAAAAAPSTPIAAAEQDADDGDMNPDALEVDVVHVYAKQDMHGWKISYRLQECPTLTTPEKQVPGLNKKKERYCEHDGQTR